MTETSIARSTRARLHDGTSIPVTVRGEGRAVLVPARLEPQPEMEAEVMRQWGGEPELGANLFAGLTPHFRVIAADYEGHRLEYPAPRSLTPDNVAADLLAIADAAGVDRFAYYGYSWLALSGLQLALRTDRLWALALGGFPPIGGPYREMLAVTRAAHAAATAGTATSTGQAGETGQAGWDEQAPDAGAMEPVEPGDWDNAAGVTDERITRQFVTLYEALHDFDDGSVALPPGLAKLAFAGSDDHIEYGKRWGGVDVRMAEPLLTHADRLAADGWTVRVIPGLDHLGAMHSAVVLPVLLPWLRETAD
jgi:pimeloyl-ACP methyl ester carboxylesterase